MHTSKELTLRKSRRQKPFTRTENPKTKKRKVLKTNKNILNSPSKRKVSLSVALKRIDVEISPKKKIFSQEPDSDHKNVRRSVRLSAKPKKSFRSLCSRLNKFHLESTDESDPEKSIEDDDVADKDVKFEELVKSDEDSSTSDATDYEDFPETSSRSSRMKIKKGKVPTASRSRKKSITTQAPPRTPPKNRKAFIPLRKTPLKCPANDFERACQYLHVSAVQDSLPCREEEFHSIYSFIEGNLTSGRGGCMYVSGVPGTGKTATVMEVLANLRESAKDGILPEFNYLEINGMRLTDPHQAYVSIWQQLNGTKATSDHAAQLLSKHFNTRQKKSTVLLVDELDLLWTRKQGIMYDIFEWPTQRQSKLIVVAIANTMDLPERMMMAKISSRLGLTRLPFLPYSYKQLQEIITSRLRGIPAFEADAIQLVSRKVAAVSGDARRCLDVCRRAIEIADKQRRTNKKVHAASIEHIHQAIQEMFSSPIIMMMRHASFHEKLILKSIVSEFRRSGLEEATIGQVLEHHHVLAAMEGLPPSNASSLIKVCKQLEASRIIIVESGVHTIYSRVRLNVSTDDVLFALNNE